MSFISNIFGAGFGTLIDRVGKVIDSVHTSVEEKAKLEMARFQIEVEARRLQAELEADLEKAYLAEMANLREQIKIELSSEDAYVRRARPTFMYIVYLVILINLIVIPFGQFITGREFQLVELPAEMWVVFGTSFLGYAYLRTREKMGGKSPFSH